MPKQPNDSESSNIYQLLSLHPYTDQLFEGAYIVDAKRKIIHWNRSAQAITGYSQTEILHRFCFNNILNHVNDEGTELCFDGCPLKATIEDGEAREADVFLQHKEGHRIPVKVRTIPLKNSLNEVIGALELFIENRDVSSLHNLIENYQQKSFEDPLTSLANRRYLTASIESKLREFRIVGSTFGIAFIDIDDFKNINDTFGHHVGDRMIKLLVDTIKSNLRGSDYFGRWGGEEFVMILGNVTEDGLLSVSEKIRKLVSSSSLRHNDQNLRISISIGSTMVKENDDVLSIIQRSDLLMYKSKLSGKNRVTIG